MEAVGLLPALWIPEHPGVMTSLRTPLCRIPLRLLSAGIVAMLAACTSPKDTAPLAQQAAANAKAGTAAPGEAPSGMVWIPGG